MKILLTNDDGYQSNEIQILKNTLRNNGYNVTMIAPVSNQSWGGTTLQASAKKTKLVSRGFNEYSLECLDVIFKDTQLPWPASPVQCYLVGEEIVPDFDILISGMNIGQNTEGSALFSGTLGAVFATISRVIGNSSKPAIAISVGEFANDERILEAANFTVKLIKYLKKKEIFLPQGVGLNINIPGGYPNGVQIKIKGVSINRAGGVYDIPGEGDDYFKVVSREGDIFETDCATRKPISDICFSDNKSLNKGYITIVPIVADTTANINSVKEVCVILNKFVDKNCFCHHTDSLKDSVASLLKK